MLQGLYSAAAGMAAQQEQLDAIGNDLANLSTSGYKSERVAFRDLLYNPVDMAGTETAVGSGAAAAVIGRTQTQGSIQQTGEPLDLAVEGEGFFQVRRPNGTVALTRDGAFAIDAKGSITDAQGNRLVPPITVPAGVSGSEVGIATDGTVTAQGRTIGRISLVTVTAPGHLLSVGDSQFEVTAGSGPARAAAGRIRQGALEGSNVSLASDMTQMVATQRAYQMSSSAIQTESQMMSIANQLRP